MSGPNKRRKQRERRWLEEQTQDALEGREGPSEGQYFVLNMETGEKTPGLNYKQAQTLWASLPRASYFPMDVYKPGKAPLRLVYTAGKLP